MRRAKKHRKRHILPGPAGVRQQRQRQRLLEEEQSTSKSKSKLQSNKSHDRSQGHDRVGDDDNDGNDVSIRSVNHIVNDNENSNTNINDNDNEKEIITNNDNDNDNDNDRRSISQSQIWDAMCLSLHRFLPLSLQGATVELPMIHTRSVSLLRRALSPHYTLLSDLHYNSNRMKIDKIVVQIDAIHSHGHVDYTVDLLDESVQVSHGSDSGNDSNGNRKRKGRSGASSSSFLLSKPEVGWLDERLVTNHPEWIRPGTVLLLHDVSLAVFRKEGSNNIGAGTGTGSTGDEGQGGGMDRMLVLSDENVICAWTASDGEDVNHKDYIYLMEKRAEVEEKVRADMAKLVGADDTGNGADASAGAGVNMNVGEGNGNGNGNGNGEGEEEDSQEEGDQMLEDLLLNDEAFPVDIDMDMDLDMGIVLHSNSNNNTSGMGTSASVEHPPHPSQTNTNVEANAAVAGNGNGNNAAADEDAWSQVRPSSTMDNSAQTGSIVMTKEGRTPALAPGEATCTRTNTNISSVQSQSQNQGPNDNNRMHNNTHSNDNGNMSNSHNSSPHQRNRNSSTNNNNNNASNAATTTPGSNGNDRWRQTTITTGNHRATNNPTSTSTSTSMPPPPERRVNTTTATNNNNNNNSTPSASASARTRSTPTTTTAPIRSVGSSNSSPQSRVIVNPYAKKNSTTITTTTATTATDSVAATTSTSSNKSGTISASTVRNPYLRKITSTGPATGTGMEGGNSSTTSITPTRNSNANGITVSQKGTGMGTGTGTATLTPRNPYAKYAAVANSRSNANNNISSTNATTSASNTYPPPAQAQAATVITTVAQGGGSSAMTQNQSQTERSNPSILASASVSGTIHSSLSITNPYRKQLGGTSTAHAKNDIRTLVPPQDTTPQLERKSLIAATSPVSGAGGGIGQESTVDPSQGGLSGGRNENYARRAENKKPAGLQVGGRAGPVGQTPASQESIWNNFQSDAMDLSAFEEEPTTSTSFITITPTPASTPITSKTQPACNNASDSESASVLVSGAKSNKQCALKQKRASSSLEPTFSSVLDNKTFDSGFDAFDEDGDDW